IEHVQAADGGTGSLRRGRRRAYDPPMERTIEGEPLMRWGFGSPGPLRDKLTAFALAGRQTATASLVADYELDGDVMPSPGDLQGAGDRRGRPPPRAAS